MPRAYTKLLYHIVFSTKNREPWITEHVQGRLYKYIGGLVRAQGGTLYDINGVEDHVHLYLLTRPDMDLSKLMLTTKSRSSKWVHDEFPDLRRFAWQEGYSAFTVSKSQEQRRSSGTSRTSGSITRLRASSRRSSGCLRPTVLSMTSGTSSSEDGGVGVWGTCMTT